MSEHTSRVSIADLELRQDEVNRRLDELNGQIERLLAEYAPAKTRGQGEA